MLIVAVHHIDYPQRLPLPEGWSIWETDTHIGETYKGIALHALEAEWSHEVIVVQDDVRFRVDPALAIGDVSVLVYGQTKREGHICPRAFSANPAGWERLKKVWLPAPNTLCEGFTRVVLDMGRVLDWTTHHG